MRNFTVLMLCWMFGIWLGLAGLDYFRVGFDSTDDYQAGERSGMSLYTDHATGVQYVKGGLFGGLQVRVNADGSVYKEVGNETQR